jgi:phosphoribosyl 1,2-cyclic phosphate phosphodiesterase
VTFLGTGASCGVPSYYCGCKACDEAMSLPSAQRSCSALLIAGAQNTLIDAGPELRTQLSRARAGDIDQVLFTHGHFDHIGGIPQLEYYVRLKSHQPLPIYANPATIQTIEQQFGFMLDALDIHSLEPWQSLSLDDVRYTALPAQHSVDTLGFLLEFKAPDGQMAASGQGALPATTAGESQPANAELAQTCSLAYFPDTGPLSTAVLERIQGVDILVIDATFNGRNWMPNSHHSIAEAIALSQQLNAGQTYLTHLSMHYDEPITVAELSAQLAQYKGRIQAAHDGLTLNL